MNYCKHKNEGEEEPNDVRRVILIHSQQVSLIQHLDLDVFELGGSNFPSEELSQIEFPTRCIITSILARAIDGAVDVEIVVRVAVVAVIDD
jgi:hypothetical protein